VNSLPVYVRYPRYSASYLLVFARTNDMNDFLSYWFIKSDFHVADWNFHFQEPKKSNFKENHQFSSFKYRKPKSCHHVKVLLHEKFFHFISRMSELIHRPAQKLGTTVCEEHCFSWAKDINARKYPLRTNSGASVAMDKRWLFFFFSYGYLPQL